MGIERELAAIPLDDKLNIKVTYRNGFETHERVDRLRLNFKDGKLQLTIENGKNRVDGERKYGRIRLDSDNLDRLKEFVKGL